jgi:hypothetical protein
MKFARKFHDRRFCGGLGVVREYSIGEQCAVLSAVVVKKTLKVAQKLSHSDSLEVSSQQVHPTQFTHTPEAYRGNNQTIPRQLSN